jgi:hypothetical protein
VGVVKTRVKCYLKIAVARQVKLSGCPTSGENLKKYPEKKVENREFSLAYFEIRCIIRL